MWLSELQGLNLPLSFWEMREPGLVDVAHIGPVRPAHSHSGWCFRPFPMQDVGDCSEHICDSDSFREMIFYLVSQHEARYFPTCANHTRALLPGELSHLPQKETCTISAFSTTAFLASCAQRLELTIWCPSFERGHHPNSLLAGKAARGHAKLLLILSSLSSYSLSSYSLHIVEFTLTTCSSMGFGKCIQPCNNYCNHDMEQFPHLIPFPPL